MIFPKMGFVEDELAEVKKLCEHLVTGSRIVSLVPAMVRVNISRTASRSITACIQFPADYPTAPLLLELKSKTLSDKLLMKLTKAADTELLTLLGKPQILKTLVFLRNFIDENPLSPCYDEINRLKDLIHSEDELKIKQKSSKVCLRVVGGEYMVKAQFVIPEEYPSQCVRMDIESNFPPVIVRYLIGYTKERARQCVEPPLSKRNAKTQFVPSPSLFLVADILVSLARSLPQQKCQGCQVLALPSDPSDVETDENSDNHVERLYCNHMFHLKCLLIYMKTPPFQGGKKCPECGEKVFHEKWKVGERLAEERWAHQQARQRELDEVTDFFK